MARPGFDTEWLKDAKNVAIVVLAVLVLLLATVVFAERIPALMALVQLEPEGEAVEVVDVVVDRTGLRSLDLFFDRPLGENAVGDILDPDPATIRPAIGGVWSWQATNVLRFEPSGGFGIAMDYELALIVDRLIGEEFYFRGETEFSIRTDDFQVERVDTAEEPRLTGDNEVVIVGNIRFNYAVEPEELAPRLRLVDPLRGEADPIPLAFDTGYRNTVIAFRSEPVRKQQTARELRLIVRDDLTPAEGNVALGEPYVEMIAVGSSEVLSVWELVAEPGESESRLRLRLSSPVDPAVAADYVSVDPEVDFGLSTAGNELLLTGGFEPGSRYTVTVAEGLPAVDDAVLLAAYRNPVRLPDLAATVGFRGEGMFLSAAGARRLAIESINVERAELVIERVYRNNLHYLFQAYGYDVWKSDSYSRSSIAHSLGDRIAEQVLELGGARNRRQTLPLDLDEYIEDAGPGLYRVAVSRPGTYRADQRWVLITDLGMVAKEGEDEILVWAASFADLAPLDGARLTLLSDQNQVIANGRTDARGMWHPTGLAATFEQNRPYLILAERGRDFSFLVLDRMRIDTSGLDVGGGATSVEGYDAYLYGERDIYRPGETVEGVAVVRDRRLQAPPVMAVALRHRDPQGLEVSSRRAETTAPGLVPFDLELPAYALTGTHSLELLVADEVIGSYRFQVEEFVPDRISVEVAAPDRRLSAGENLEFEVEGAYLFGPPAAGLSVEGRVRLEELEFVPAGYDEFSFSNAEREFARRQILEVTDTLDEAGLHSFAVEIPTGLRVESSLQAVITARVQEQGGRGVVAQRVAPVHPYPYYVGLRREGDTYAEPGVAESFEYATVAPDGTPAPSGRLLVELFKDEWNTVLRRTPSGSFRYESTRTSRLIDSRVVEAGTSRGGFELTVPDFGSYRAAVTDPESGASAQVEFYASGWGYSPWAIENPARVEIELDRTEYRPGESASVQVRSPFAGKLLLTVERERVYETSVHQLEGNTATIELAIPEVYRPNVYVTATVVRAAGDLDPRQDAIGRAYGAIPLYVDRGSNRLSIGIEAPDEIRPGATLDVRVSAEPGASLTVAAVDEGILQLINQSTPGPFEYFYRKLALGVSSADSFALLLPEVEIEGPAIAGGGAAGEGMAQYVRTEGIRRVRPVAFWSGVVQAGPDGSASVQFAVPDFQGALRVMAVGAEGRRFGSSSAMTRVRSPLVVLPTFPRFLSLEETARIPVTVRNDTGADGEFEASLAVSGAARIDGAGSSTVALADDGQETIYFDVVSGSEPGDVRLDVEAVGGGETANAGVDLTVKPDLPAQTSEIVGSLVEASTTLPASGQQSYRPGTVRRTLRLSRLPLIQLVGQLRYLVQYPWGCLEQVTSRAFPLIYFGDLARELDPELFEQMEPAGLVQDSIRRLATLQHFTGGFTLWPRAEEVAPWPSIYSAHFLVEARRAGFLVPGHLHDGAMGFLAAEARARASYAGDELERVTYSLYVLARAGAPDLGTMDFVRDQHQSSLRPLSRALLTGAYAAIGRTDAVAELIAGLDEVEQIRRQTGGNFSSTLRNRAMVLLALLDAIPEDPRVPRIAQRLARDVEVHRYWNTQESSLALLALGQFFRRQAERAPYSGTVIAGDQEIGSFDTETAVFEIPAGRDIRVEMDPGYEAGAAFYSLRSRGVPTDESFRPVTAGLELRSELRGRNGGTLDPRTIRQGDLVVLQVRIRSTAGRLENVAMQILLPAGFEIENPRLSTTETLPWVTDANLEPAFFDFRDDQALIFFDLPDQNWRNAYVVLRAVTPGVFRVPPLQAEAMYEPEIRATGERGTVEVMIRR